MSAGRNGRKSRALAAGVALAALLGSGCATILPGDAPPPDLASAAPADAPPELHYLIGRELELDGRVDEALAAYGRALDRDPESLYLLKQLAELSARSNRLSDAVQYAERAHALAPEDPGLRLFLGTLYRFRKETDSALRVLRTDEGEPVAPDAALLVYGILSDARRFEEARDTARWLIENEPDSLRGTLALADAMEKLGDPEGSEAALRDGLTRQPEELALYGALARARRERGDRLGEIEIYEEILAQQPDHHATLLARADAELDLGHREAAISTLRRVEELHPRDLRTSVRLAFLEYESGNLEDAEERFARALRAQPKQYEVAYFLGVVQRRLEKEDEARAVLAAIPPEHARFADARVQLAAMDERRGDLDSALAEVEQARAIAPGRAIDLYYASLRAKNGDTAGALAFLEGLLEETPEDPEVLYNIGIVHGEAGEVDEALRVMQRVLELDEDHAGALNYVGYTWAERGTNLDEAEALISRALELRPDDGFITDSLGWVHYMRARPLLETGRTQEARAWLGRALDLLRQAAELTGGDPVISEHLGDTYLLLGQKERALLMYEEAVRLEPRLGEQPELFDKLERLRDELKAQ